MNELMQAKDVLNDFLEAHKEIAQKYNIKNEQYREGLADAIRIIDKIVNGEIERMAKYYEAE